MNRRNRCSLILLLLASVFIVAAKPDARAQGSHTLEGRVMLPNGGQPQAPVRVTLTFNGRRVHENFTDLSGRFTFSGLSGGTYQLTAEGDGTTFETTTVRANVNAFGSMPQSFTQNIQLRPKADNSFAATIGTISAEEIDPEVPSAARDKYRQGLKSAADKPEQAVKLFQEAVEAYPSFYAASLALAEQYAKLRRYDEALLAFRRASEIKPDRAEAYVGVGITLVNQKRYDEGARLLRGIVELDKNFAPAYLPLGYAEMMTGDYRAAECHLLRAYELSKAALAHVYLANVYEQLGEPAKAIEHLQAYLKENPQTSNADAVRGAIEKLRKKTKDKKP